MTQGTETGRISSFSLMERDTAVGSRAHMLTLAANGGALIVDIGASGERPDATITLDADQARGLLDDLPKLIEWLTAGHSAPTWDQRSGLLRTEQGWSVCEPKRNVSAG